GWADALKEADAIAAKEPANAFGLYFRAAALNARGDRRDALAAIDNALSAGQSPPEFHAVRGDILAGLDRLGDAEHAYRAALVQEPKYAAAFVGLSEVLRRQNRIDEARPLLAQAKSDEPANASVRLALSALAAVDGKFEDALKELESLPRENWTPRVALI